MVSLLIGVIRGPSPGAGGAGVTVVTVTIVTPDSLSLDRYRLIVGSAGRKITHRLPGVRWTFPDNGPEHVGADEHTH